MSSSEPYEVVLGSGKWVREEAEEESDLDEYSINNVTWRRAADRQERILMSDIELITNLISQMFEDFKKKNSDIVLGLRLFRLWLI